MLKVDNIDTNYGVVAMLRNVTFEVTQGEFVCVLGPNGAGKTTTFRALSGLLPLAGGRIELMGHDLAGLQTESLSALGIGFVPEGRRLFAEISVRDNIRLGFEAQKAKGAFSDCLEQMLMVVVLPAPFGPSRPKISPWLTERSMPSTATTRCLPS